MEYTVQGLASLAGVSARTLRYYDQIGLLRPARLSDGGYRLYGGEEVDRLQQILFYREMGLPLQEIGQILANPDFHRIEALREHKARLLEQRERVNQLLETVQRTIDAAERNEPMMDKEKFEGFKQELIDRNEADYGEEIREKYGDEAVDASNRKLLNLSEEEYERMKRLEQEILQLLDEAFAAKDVDGAAAARLAQVHKEWLLFSWKEYSPEAHRNLGEMYVEDSRFAAYYDRGVPGKAAFLRDALHRHIKGNADESSSQPTQ